MQRAAELSCHSFGDAIEEGVDLGVGHAGAAQVITRGAGVIDCAQVGAFIDVCDIAQHRVEVQAAYDLVFQRIAYRACILCYQRL